MVEEGFTAEPAPLPPPPLPPPPPPEPPPPPISRLRPWAPQLRAAARPREGSRANLREPPKTDPKIPPLDLDRHYVTADRRRALPKPLSKTMSNPLRDADVALCVADEEELLSEPESQGSAESISGDIARSWDPSTRDSRYHYARDIAVPFSTPWHPLNWNDDKWLHHLEVTGAYNPRAHEEALEAKLQAERDEENIMKAAAVATAIKKDQISLKTMAYSEIRKESTPRGLAMQKFLPVPPNDPVIRPALADALAAYRSLPRGAFDALRVELEGGRRLPETGGAVPESGMARAPWQEPDGNLDVPGRAWL